MSFLIAGKCLTVFANTLLAGQKRQGIIQRLLPLFPGQKPPREEIDAHILQAGHPKKAGARISLARVSSAARPMAHCDGGHLRLKTRSEISHRIRAETGLPAEVY